MTRHPRSTKAYQAAAAPWSWAEGAVRQNWSVGSKVDGDRAAEVEEADIWMIPAGRVIPNAAIDMLDAVAPTTAFTWTTFTSFVAAFVVFVVSGPSPPWLSTMSYTGGGS